MSKRIPKEEELAKRKLDLQLDEELEDTFPASDALKITRSVPGRSVTSYQASADVTPDAKTID